MAGPGKAALIRIAILLLATCAGAFFWEHARTRGFVHRTGEVVAVHRVLAGRGGDGEAFTIRYRVGGASHQFTTRRGILDHLGALSGLARGDRVPVAADPDPPYHAVLDTVTGRYGLTLTFGALAVIFGGVLGILALRGRGSPGAGGR